MIVNLTSYDCKTNSPCQDQRKGMEKMDADIWV